MNELFVPVAILSFATMAVVVGYRYVAADGLTLANRTFVPFFGFLVIVASLSLYSMLGRPGDWQVKKADDSVAYLVTAKITEAQRRVEANPEDASAQHALAVLHLEVGQYEEAVERINRVTAIVGEHADLMGLKAFALYYRDGKQLTTETRTLIDRVLVKNPYEVQTRMLLGQDAYTRGNYAEAVGHWQVLLDAGVAPDKQGQLLNAIGNAKAKMTRSQN